MEQHRNIHEKMEFSVIIPVFNEESNLVVLHDRLTKVIQELAHNYEIIFVDDGSVDGSLQTLVDMNQKDDKVKIISFTRNFGQHIAITAGLEHSKGEKVIIMDSDLQDKPEEIPKLLAKLDEGYDIAYGYWKERTDNIFKRVTSKIYLALLARLSNQTVNPYISSFRIMTRRVVDAYNQFGERSRFYGGLVAWLGFPYAIVAIEHGERFAGKTKYSFWKMIKLAAEGVISFSDLPLRWIVYFGIAISGISFIFALFYFIAWLIWKTVVPGYTSIIVSSLFIGGVQLIVLGVIGRYIGGIYAETKSRPLYVVKTMIE
jgi:glycosyltransferase involved in cell wall biosynthesis